MDADDDSTPATTHPEGAPCPWDLHPHSVCPHCHHRHEEGHAIPFHRFHEANRNQRQEAADSQSLEAVERQAASRSRRARERSSKKAIAETSQSSAEIHRPPEEEGSTIRSTAKSRRRARKKERSRRKAAAETTPSQSSAEIHRPSEEQASTMVDVGASLHEQELSDWMSQLFEKLDLEVYEDSVCTGKMAQGGTYPIVEGGISSEIYRKSQGKDSTMNVDGLHEDQSSDWISVQFGKSTLEANADSICSTERPPPGEGGIFSEIYRSSEEKDSTMARAKTSGVWFEDDDGYVNWLIKILKDGGHDDILSGYNPDGGEKHVVHYDAQDELCDPIEVDNEAMDYCETTERVSKKETIKNGIKWMSEECFLAFTKYAEKINFEGIKHKFGELRYQCLSVEAYDKIFHHYNFTIETEHRSSDVSTSELYFAEVKQQSGVQSYFCCPLDQNDEGHCYGCKSQDMYDLKHPITSCYEEGNADICWPFIDDTDSDSDGGDDCGGC